MEKLTFTRFVAAMCVVFTHFGRGIPFIDDLPWAYLLRQGTTMVSYFFVLSGFIMAAVYWDLQDRADRRAYWAARFARIYPVYLLSLLFMMSLGGATNGARPLATFVLNAAMIQAWLPQFAMTGNPPGWSLSAEAFFYLAFPFCMPLLRRMPGIARPLLVVGVVWLVSQVGFHVGREALDAHSPKRATTRSITIRCCTSTRSSSAWRRSSSSAAAAGARAQRRAPARRSSSCSRARHCIAASLVALWRGLPAGGGFLSSTNGLLAPLFALFIGALALDASPWTRWLASRPLVALGEMSYAVYMLQDPMRELVYRLVLGSTTMAPVPLFWLFVGALLVVSGIVWRCYEVPLRRVLRARLAGPATRRERPAAVV